LETETKFKTKQDPSLKNSCATSQIGASKQPARPPPFKSNFNQVSSTSGAPSKLAGGLPTKSSTAPNGMRPPPQSYVNPQAQLQAKMQATLDAQIAKEKAALTAKAKLRQKIVRNVEPEPEFIEEEEIELPDIASEYVDQHNVCIAGLNHFPHL
jgi:hypothetical protein